MADCRQTYADAIGKLKSEVSTEEFEAIKKLTERFDDVMSEYGISTKAAIDDFTNGNISQASQALDRLVQNAITQDAKQVARESIAAFRNAKVIVDTFDRIKTIAATDTSNRSTATKQVIALGEIIATSARNRLSLENTKKALTAYYRNQRFVMRVEKELGDKWDNLLSDPQTKADTVREYFNLLNQTPSGTPNVAAKKLAKIIYDVRGEQRAQLSVLGANIARQDGLPIRFDWQAIKRDGRETFVNDLANNLNEKTHGDITRRTALAEDIYASMERNKGYIDWHEIGDKNPVNNGLVPEYQAKPTLDFANADGWIKLNDRYGTTDVMEGIYSDIVHNAEKEALVRLLGANPDRNFDELLRRAQLDENGKIDKAAENEMRRTRAFYDRATKVGVPEWLRWTQVNQVGRTINTASDLGGAVIASLIDLPAQIYSAKVLANVPVIQNIRNILGNGFSRAEQKRAAYIGAYAEGMANNIGERFGTNNSGGFDKVSRGSVSLTNWVLRLSGLELWTGVNKTGAASTLELRLGELISKKVTFDKLPEQFRTSLERFEITAQEWNSFGKQHLNEANRFDLFRLDRSNAESGFDTQTKMRSWLIDAVETFVLTPGDRDRYYSTFGLDPNSVKGTAIASMTQFMSFPIAFTRKLVARTMFYNEDSVTKATQNIAALLLVTTTMGGIITQTREMLQGKKPYQWDDGDFLLKSLSTGGGFGIASDLAMKFGLEEALKAVFHADERSISDMRGLLGPLYSDIAKVGFEGIAAVGNAINGEEDKALRNLNQVTQTILKSVPGRSIWYTAALYRAAVMDNASYAIDPQGYREAQRRVWRDTKGRAEGWFDQTQPSQNVGWIGDIAGELRQQ
jgi:hypothetical protein